MNNELEQYLKDNNVSGYHSGGGMHHLAYEDENKNVFWLINHVDYDEVDGKVVPTELDDAVICSFDINNTAENEDDMEYHLDILSRLDIDGVVFENKYTPLLWILDKNLKEAIELIKESSNAYIDLMKEKS